LPKKSKYRGIHLRPGELRNLIDSRGMSNFEVSQRGGPDRKTLSTHLENENKGWNFPSLARLAEIIGWQEVINLIIDEDLYIFENNYPSYRKETQKLDWPLLSTLLEERENILRQLKETKENTSEKETTLLSKPIGNEVIAKEGLKPPETTIENLSKIESPAKLDKNEFLKPFIEDILRRRKGINFIERKLSELFESKNLILESNPVSKSEQILSYCINAYEKMRINELSEEAKLVLKQIEQRVESVPVDMKGFLKKRLLSDAALRFDKNMSTIEEYLKSIAYGSSIKSDVDRIMESRIWTIERIINTKDNIIIVGEPGSGKTSLLQSIILELYNVREDDIIPIYVNLEGYIPKNDSKMRKHILSEARIRHNYELSDNVLYANKLIILFDHLEMAKSPSTKEVIDDIKYLFSEEGFGKHRAIIGCRINRYHEAISHFKTLKINDLEEHEVEALLSQYNMLEVIGHSDNKKLWMQVLKKPLLLNMLIKIYSDSLERGASIDIFRESDLYSKFIGDYFGEEKVRLEKYGKIDLFLALKKDILSSLAFKMHSDNCWFLDSDIAREFIMIEMSSAAKRMKTAFDVSSIQELIIQIEEEGVITYEQNVYRFLHPSIQEFLCARKLLEMVHNMKYKKYCALIKEILFKKYTCNFDWGNVIIYLSGLMSDSTELIKAVLSFSGGIHEWIIILYCLANSNKIEPKIRVECIKKIFNMYVEMDCKRSKTRNIVIPLELMKIAIDADGELIKLSLLECLEKGYYHYKMSDIWYCLENIQAIRRLFKILRKPLPASDKIHIYRDISQLAGEECGDKHNLFELYASKYEDALYKMGQGTLYYSPTEEELKLLEDYEVQIMSKMTD